MLCSSCDAQAWACLADLALALPGRSGSDVTKASPHAVIQSSPYLAHSWCHSTQLGRNRLHPWGHMSHHSGTGTSGCKQAHRNQQHKLQETSRDVFRALVRKAAIPPTLTPTEQLLAQGGEGCSENRSWVCALSKGLKCFTPSCS